MSENNNPIENTIRWFNAIYLRGIPPMITDDSAFLSFVCVLTALEALAGYRYSNVKEKGVRFKQFVKDYMPDAYGQYADALWDFRNAMIHAFTPKSFSLVHHHGEHHMQKDGGSVILNAEDFFEALSRASEKYFLQLRAQPDLQNLLLKRLQNKDGGAITVGPLELQSQTTNGQ